MRLKKYREESWPNYNQIACKVIDNYGKKHDYNFKHALNGGEKLVCANGNYYFVDGYDKKKNVVIEYYEKGHKYTSKQDEKRKQEIIKTLKCKFIEIKEWESKWNQYHL